MAVIAMHDCVVKLDNASGTPVDISGQSNQAQIRVENIVGSYFVFGNRWEQNSEGGARWSGSLRILEKPDTGQAHELIRAWMGGSGKPGLRTLTVDTPDSNTGSLRYSGEINPLGADPITNHEAGSGDPSQPSLNFKGHDALTISVIA